MNDGTYKKYTNLTGFHFIFLISKMQKETLGTKLKYRFFKNMSLLRLYSQHFLATSKQTVSLVRMVVELFLPHTLNIL